ncbi:MAG TPA: putative PEP-binding protein, partial [Pyrinomonadaceae bacterium]|nr:putative PEP-binding protein [Pyrinomonadaceae bacterium]
DGHEITIRVNADLPPAYEIGARSGAKGIGLYRSEVILNQFREFPSEAEQAAVYRHIAETAGEAGVRIRTFDVSVEQLASRTVSKERNPSLGLRSIRLSLTDSTHFRTQIRAILRASHQQNVDIILPMISGVFEILRLREIIEEERANLQNEGVAIGSPLIGAMIEIPSAVMTANEIARHVDFLCLGTNDLVQYLLAVDRDNETVADWYQTLHPAVIRAIREVIAAGNNAGIPVAICGEIAGSPFYVPLLIGLGARELSMNVNSIPQIRHLIAGISAQDAASLVQSMEKFETAAEMEDALRNHYLRSWSHLFPKGLLSSKYPQ